MGYYRGDGGNYYRGDYYRGDPFLGGLLLAGAKKVGGAIIRGVTRGARRARAAAPGLAKELVPSTISGAIGYELGAQMGPGTAIVKVGKQPRQYRRLNPLNPKALRRALRRAEGFEKFAARTINSLYRVIDGRKVRTFKKRTPTS